MEERSNRQQLLEDEWYQVRYAGEIPEIAFHSAIYYLTEDKDGPQLILSKDDHSYLLSAAAARYFDIITRDISPENRDTTAYRGVLRTIANWRRYKRFCDRHQMSEDSIKQEIRNQLKRFLANELIEVRSGSRRSCINCTFEELHSFGVELDLPFDEMQPELGQICPLS